MNDCGHWDISNSVRVAACVLALALVAAAGGCRPASSPKPMNVVLISLDTLMPERMGTYGGGRPNTPRIDSLAKRSLVFDNAYTTSPWTLPGHASMLTGRYPSSISHVGMEESLYVSAPLLSNTFKKAGYKTAAVTGGGFCSADRGFDRGFDFFESVIKETQGLNTAVDRVTDWMRTHQEQPFFFFFHTFAVHAPFIDRRYVEDLEGGRFRQVFTKDGDPELAKQLCCRDMEVTVEEREFILALYDGGIARADEMVGRIVDKLDELGILDDTIVIITSDHGEGFWRHAHRGGHGHTLYDELLRIPFIWFEPGMPQGGQRRSAAVSLIDIAPTLVARLGLPGEDNYDGVDLTPVFADGQWGIDRPLFAEAVHHGPARFSVRANGGKLIVVPEPDVQIGLGEKHPVAVDAPVELFLESDRNEKNNRAEDPQYKQLRAQLEALLEQHRSAGAPPRAEPESPELTPELEEQLRALGYLD